MSEMIRAVLEYNPDGAILYSADDPGAFARAASEALAVVRLPEEVRRYRLWSGIGTVQDLGRVEVVQRHHTGLCVQDADSEVMFDGERLPPSREEYERLRALVIRSAEDFDRLYRLLPDADATDIAPRETFYGGGRPRTGREMYVHTNRVTAYYLGEMGLEWDNLPDLVENRVKALQSLEKLSGFPDWPARQGSYGEWWSLRKAMRRFIWHDRIHAKAMYRMAKRMWGEIEDVFRLEGGECAFCAEENAGGWV